VRGVRLDHVTAIVGDLDAATEALRRLFGTGPVAETVLPGMSVRTFSSGGVEIHLNVATGPGPVAEYHRAHGPGFHHLALQFPDLDAALAELSTRGFRLLGAPVETAPGLREVFLDPATTAGLWIQLVERRGGEAVALDGAAVDELVEQLRRK
jgi:methylmalonyl-CoA/ethylmalonyl-CoA epimerase